MIWGDININDYWIKQTKKAEPLLNLALKLKHED
jgi:hypothetical protein